MYFSQLLQRSFNDTWNAVFGQSFLTIMIGAAVFGATLVWLRWRSQHEEVQTRLRDFGIAVLFTALAFVVVFLVYLVALTPAKLWHEEHERADTAAKQSTTMPAPTPFQLEIHEHGVDTESRNQIDSLRKQLDTANETIRQLDPLRRPIGSANFAAAVAINSDQAINTHFMDSGGAMALCRESEILLISSTSDSFGQSDGKGHVIYRALFNAPVGGPAVGKALSDLASAEFIQIELKALPTDAQIIGGEALITLNGTEQITFPIPSQAATNGRVFIRDLYPLRKTLILAPATTQPSSTPDKGASPH